MRMNVQYHTSSARTKGGKASRDSATTQQNVMVTAPPSVMQWYDAIKKIPILLYSTVAIGILILLFYLSHFAAQMNDAAGTSPHFLSCRSWTFGSGCGLWGINCRPFETSEWMAFRCPTRCLLSGSSALAVYGSGPYRGDSRICRAAIHAGVIGGDGGCALMRFTGEQNAFHGSERNGVRSQDFLSWFPKNYEFQAAPSLFCTDLSWYILAYAIAIFGLYAVFRSSNPEKLFYLLVAWGFFYVRLISRPYSFNFHSVAINSAGEVMVLVAASVFVYKVAPCHTFSKWSELQLGPRVVLWSLCYVVPYHVMINMNFFEYIPWMSVQLGGFERYGGSPTNTYTYIVYGVLGFFVVLVARYLLRLLYRERLWKKYVLYYLLALAPVFLSWAMFPSTSFHLHHTMLGAVLLPFTRFPTPVAATAQSALLGMFVHGYAAWGWSSYLDIKPKHLIVPYQKDAPSVLHVSRQSATLAWEKHDDADGYLLTLNQVEVYRGIDPIATISGLQPNITYFTEVRVIQDGYTGYASPEAIFTTLL